MAHLACGVEVHHQHARLGPARQRGFAEPERRGVRAQPERCRLRPFSYFIAVITVWLLFWALLRGHRLRATASVPQPAPLPLATHATAFGLEEAALARWTEARVLVVHFDATGQVSHAEAKRTD